MTFLRVLQLLLRTTASTVTLALEIQHETGQFDFAILQLLNLLQEK